MNVLPATSNWLDQFAACVRDRDLQRGRKLFESNVRSFGTRAEQAFDLTDLVENQWSRVWFSTRGFRFLEDTIEEFFSTDNSQVCVLALWESEGLDATGNTFLRRGRCTILLHREDSSSLGYLAVHTHFSKTPSDEL